MMLANDLLIDGFERTKQGVHLVVKELSTEQLAVMPQDSGNSIAWLVWHIARVQDDHIASLAGSEQIWTLQEWDIKFGLPFDTGATGYGQSKAEVAQLQVAAELLTGYYDAVHAASIAYLSGLSTDDYKEVVDKNWNPPVTRAVRLMSIVNDNTQHVGQAAYVRGLIAKSC